MPNGRAVTTHIEGKRREGHRDHAVAELAARQCGVVARSQLVEIGISARAVEARIDRGHLHPVFRGVYAVGHAAVTRRGRWMAGVLVGGADAVLSHVAAAALWGIRPFEGRTVDVTVGRALRSRRGLRFHRLHLPADEVTVHERIPITTIPRTLFDLAAVVSVHQLKRAVNEAEIRRLWDPLSLDDLLVRHPRRPGAAAVRAVLATPGTGITRNDFEARFLDLLREARLPQPETNVWLEIDGIWIEADCLWREERLIVELDGGATHATRHAFEHDRAKDRRLVAAGWRVIRVTWRQLRDEPDAVTRDLRASLECGANLRRA